MLYLIYLKCNTYLDALDGPEKDLKFLETPAKLSSDKSLVSGAAENNHNGLFSLSYHDNDSTATRQIRALGTDGPEVSYGLRVSRSFRYRKEL